MTSMHGRAMIAVALVSAATSCWAQANDAEVEQARGAFVERMVEAHGFERDALAAALSAATIDQRILDAMSRPAERVVPWHEYRKIFLTPERITAGVQFWQDNAAAVERISAEYGVAPEMVVGIIGVETFYGRIMGRYRVIDALSTLAFAYRVIDALSTLAFAYPPRARFFASELEAFLLLTREEELDVFEPLGSYAGAMGGGQFIPSSYRAYAVDANNDGHRNIWGDWEDVVGSVANYFAKHGWRAGEPVVSRATRPATWSGPEPTNRIELDSTVGKLAELGYEFDTPLPASAPAAAFSYEAEGGGSEYWIGHHNFAVIMRYNRSPKYALAAHQLSQEIKARYFDAQASASRSLAE